MLTMTAGVFAALGLLDMMFRSGTLRRDACGREKTGLSEPIALWGGRPLPKGVSSEPGVKDASPASRLRSLPAALPSAAGRRKPNRSIALRPAVRTPGTMAGGSFFVPCFLLLRGGARQSGIAATARSKKAAGPGSQPWLRWPSIRLMPAERASSPLAIQPRRVKIGPPLPRNSAALGPR